MVTIKKNYIQMSPVTPEKSTISKEERLILPKQFMEPLRAGHRSITKKRRKAGKNRIATESSEKNEIVVCLRKIKKKFMFGIERNQNMRC